MIYGILQRSPAGRMLVRYVGSSAFPAEQRVKWHVAGVKQVASWNPGLADLLRAGFPSFKVLAVVPDDQRFEAEAELTRKMRKHHRLVNVLDGRHHTRESKARIARGKRHVPRRRPALALVATTPAGVRSAGPAGPVSVHVPADAWITGDLPVRLQQAQGMAHGRAGHVMALGQQVDIEPVP